MYEDIHRVDIQIEEVSCAQFGITNTKYLSVDYSLEAVLISCLSELVKFSVVQRHLLAQFACNSSVLFQLFQNQISDRKLLLHHCLSGHAYEKREQNL